MQDLPVSLWQSETFLPTALECSCVLIFWGLETVSKLEWLPPVSALHPPRDEWNGSTMGGVWATLFPSTEPEDSVY
jgi:hypothetical protein